MPKMKINIKSYEKKVRKNWQLKLISLLLDNELIASNFDVKFFDIKI